MRNTWKIWLASALMTGSAAWAAGAAGAAAPAATPGAAPAAGMQTFVCKDGTSVSAATSKGACKGHKGIDKGASATPAAAAAPVAAAAPAAAAAAPASAPAPAGKKAAAATKTPAPGGGPGMVWANENTKVYHCQGDRYYGTTKNGKYMSEADAKAAGMHASHNKACS